MNYPILRSNIILKRQASKVTSLSRCVASSIRFSTTLVSEKRPIFAADDLKQAQKNRLKALGPYISRLPASVIPYAELMRLEKPVGTLFVFVPATWAVLIGAAEALVPLSTTLYTLVVLGAGSLVIRGAGCTINDLLDRKMDSQVIRTVERPIASGRVSAKNASIFFAAQTLVGVGLLLQLPADCLWLGMASFPLICAYPLFKRFTYYPQVVLSACINWGALIGFPAIGLIDFSSMIPLYLGSFLWCMTYDTIYAHQDKKFDLKAGVKSTALKWGNKSRAIITGMTAAQFGLFALVGLNSGLIAGPGFLAGLGIFGYRMFSIVRKVDLDDPRDCWKHFNACSTNGYYFTAGLAFDYLLKFFGFL
ncbi:4-hydroxybenzoate octaprenyltransferase Ecym_2520 [Eremothecium cymbalariae DBVPG|uniref:4-hydroxybenzoate polyprenyltransferase, mitochondrial n=1 Tax=Eremothecium cymbalariae (strain CBS 270.75 / DBVPG 7215 / KCTC 17166 / NRRL Y-17582) TaxID=931890 RepID=G8JQ83_ERECY|nr:Hypothetical protein Ecym_2520 [Eremothecium cymbalariae DBVPG\